MRAFQWQENRDYSKIIEGKYSNRHHVASFVGYFPAHDPKVVITVVVDEPKMTKRSSGLRGVVAAPSFQKVGKGIINYWGLKPENNEQTVASHAQYKNRAL